MRMIARAIGKPDVTEFVARAQSEDEFLHEQFFSAKPLIIGAAAVVTENRQECESCHTASDLLEAFEDAMDAGQDAADKARLAKMQTVDVDDLYNILSECNGPVLVCVYTDEREPMKEWFRVKTTDDASKPNGKKNGKAKGKAVA